QVCQKKHFVWWDENESRTEFIGKLLIGATLLVASPTPLLQSSQIQCSPAPSSTGTGHDARRQARLLLRLELEVLKMENELSAALLHRDLAALRRIYGDDYFSVKTEGIIGEKASVLRELESGEIT